VSTGSAVTGVMRESLSSITWTDRACTSRISCVWRGGDSVDHQEHVLAQTVVLVGCHGNPQQGRPQQSQAIEHRAPRAEPGAGTGLASGPGMRSLAPSQPCPDVTCNSLGGASTRGCRGVRNNTLPPRANPGPHDMRRRGAAWSAQVRRGAVPG
jgi:hypothetical protein